MASWQLALLHRPTAIDTRNGQFRVQKTVISRGS
jgi:hypothetical protein